LPIGFQDDRCIVVEADVGAIIAAIFFVHADDDSMYYFTLFDHALRRCLFDRCHHDITNVPVAASGAAQNTDDE